jgi:uncharacterized damage-inducible protein DinB
LSQKSIVKLAFETRKMKKHLTEFFHYNDWANRKLLETVLILPEKSEALKLFSHLIATQNKWLNRITKQADDSTFPWFGEVLPVEELAAKWQESLKPWLELLEKQTEETLEKYVILNRPSDGKAMSLKLRDLLLQLNYHNIHHRAQINTIISKQGITPPATDYIFTVLKEADSVFQA